MPESKQFARTHSSLLYLVSYLTAGGAGLLVAPQLAMELFQATGEYDDLMLRMIGTFMLALAILVAQIIRTRATSFYRTTLLVRGLFLVAFAAFYAAYRDPFLRVLIGIVGLGFALTASAQWSERGVPKDSAGP